MSALERDDGVTDVAGPLRDRTIAELLPIAAGLGIEGRSRMRHDQLVAAIGRARSRQGGRSAAARTGAKQTKQAPRKQAPRKQAPRKQAAAKKAASTSARGRS
nr:Rho termination factor N-terminal domain-containing protein [Nocardioides soli]